MPIHDIRAEASRELVLGSYRSIRYIFLVIRKNNTYLFEEAGWLQGASREDYDLEITSTIHYND